MKGKNFLKVTGILMIIGGAAAIIASIIAMAGVAVLVAVSGGGGAGVIYLGLIIALIGGVLELIAGIKGVKDCNDPSKAQSCIVWGVIVAVVSVVGVIIASIGGRFSFLNLLLGLVLPVLYIIGASMNKKEAAMGAAQSAPYQSAPAPQSAPEPVSQPEAQPQAEPEAAETEE